MLREAPICSDADFIGYVFHLYLFIICPAKPFFVKDKERRIADQHSTLVVFISNPCEALSVRRIKSNIPLNPVIASQDICCRAFTVVNSIVFGVRFICISIVSGFIIITIGVNRGNLHIGSAFFCSQTFNSNAVFPEDKSFFLRGFYPIIDYHGQLRLSGIVPAALWSRYEGKLYLRGLSRRNASVIGYFFYPAAVRLQFDAKARCGSFPIVFQGGNDGICFVDSQWFTRIL